MNPPLCRLAAVLLTAAAAAVPSMADDKSNPAPSPKPAPDWVKIIDQGDLDPRLKGYKTPEGVKVEIVAEAPVVVNPVGMTFAEDGTPYVIERRHGAKDVVCVLSDVGGKGVYDAARVVLEDETPRDILLYQGWLYVAGRGQVRRYRRTRSNGPFDVREVVAQGFSDVRGVSIGPDGWLYITASAGDNDVEGSDGGRATVLGAGAVLRCRPDGSKLQTYAIGFFHAIGRASFDAAGNPFHADNGDYDAKDGEFTECRLMHVSEGADFGYRTTGPIRAAAGEPPGKTPPMLAIGRGYCGGLLIYDDARFPENYQGLVFDVFVPRAAPKAFPAVHAYKVERKGATFEVAQEFDFVKSDDPLFWPVQVVLGPDGAIYVVDYRSRSGDGEHGRIYRLSWTGVKDQAALPPRGMDSWAKIARLGDDDLVKAMSNEDASDREYARRELARRGEKERPALLKLFKDAEQPDPARIAALGALESMWDRPAQDAAASVLEHDSNRALRRLAADALGLNAPKGDSEVHSILLRALNDTAPEVRRSAALAMSHVAADGAPDNLVNTWSFDDGRDPYLRDGLVRAIENLGPPGVEQLIALGESGVEKDWNRMVQAFTMMQTRPAADAIPRALENPHLSATQRAALIRSYENYRLDPPVSLAPAVDYLIAHPKEEPAVKQAGVEVLSVGGAAAGDKAVGWLLNLLDEKDPKLTVPAVGALAALGVGSEEARRVGQAYLDKKLPAETQEQVAQILRRHADKDAMCAQLLAAVMKSGQ